MRWPVIIFSRITVFGENVDLFPVSEMPLDVGRYRDERDVSVATGFILPSYASDILVTVLGDDGNVTRENTCAAYAGGLFLREARGLPLDDISVETSSKIYELTLSEKYGKLGIILPKCKVLYSNKLITVDGIEVFVSALTVGDHIYRVCECENSDTFSDGTLRALTMTYGAECIDGVCAVSPSCDGYAAKLHLLHRERGALLRAALAAATRISSIHAIGEIRLSLCGVDFLFCETSGGFCAVDMGARVYLLSAPDFS